MNYYTGESALTRGELQEVVVRTSKNVCNNFEPLQLVTNCGKTGCSE